MQAVLQWTGGQLLAAVALVISLLVSFAVNRKLKQWADHLEQEKRQAKAVREGLKTLLESHLADLHGKYTERGYCPVTARQTAESLYNAYLELEPQAGQAPHFLAGLLETLNHLPTKPPAAYGKRRTDTE